MYRKCTLQIKCRKIISFLFLFISQYIWHLRMISSFRELICQCNNLKSRYSIHLNSNTNIVLKENSCFDRTSNCNFHLQDCRCLRFMSLHLQFGWFFIRTHLTNNRIRCHAWFHYQTFYTLQVSRKILSTFKCY